MSGELKVVWVGRCQGGRATSWRQVGVAYNPDSKEMYQRIAFALSDGICNGDEEVYEIAVGTIDAPPADGVEPFDTADAEGGFGGVRINFETHRVEYIF